jgi:hypothetical protein
MADEEDIEDNEDNDEQGLDVESPYRDISLLRADSSRKNERTALNHFTTYLKSEKVIAAEEDYVNLCEDKVTPAVLGKFADYLFRIVEKRDGIEGAYVFVRN